MMSICVKNNHGYVPCVVITNWFCLQSWLITGFATKITRLVPHVEQELLTVPEHLSWPSNFSGICVDQSVIIGVVFCRLLFVRLSCFGHCIVCPSSNCGFWLPLWYFQAFLKLFLTFSHEKNRNETDDYSTKPGTEFMLSCYGRENSFCSTSGTRCVNMTHWTYPWSHVTRILSSGSPSHGGDRKTIEVMTSTLGSVASLLAATFYQGNHDINHMLFMCLKILNYN
jgi:hypothetical protein